MPLATESPEQMVRVPLPALALSVRTSIDGIVDEDELNDILSSFLFAHIQMDLPYKYDLKSVESNSEFYSLSTVTNESGTTKSYEYIVSGDALFASSSIPPAKEIIESIVARILEEKSLLGDLLELFQKAQNPAVGSSTNVDVHLLRQIEARNPAQNSINPEESVNSNGKNQVVPVVVILCLTILVIVTVTRYYDYRIKKEKAREEESLARQPELRQSHKAESGSNGEYADLNSYDLNSSADSTKDSMDLFCLGTFGNSTMQDASTVFGDVWL